MDIFNSVTLPLPGDFYKTGALVQKCAGNDDIEMRRGKAGMP